MEQTTIRPLRQSSTVSPRYSYNQIQPCIHYWVPFLQAITLMVLSLLWRSRTWLERIKDLAACLVCLAVHHLQQPLLCLGLAVSYTIYTGSPGSFSSWILPSYQQFKNGLKVFRRLIIKKSAGYASKTIYQGPTTMRPPLLSELLGPDGREFPNCLSLLPDATFQRVRWYDLRVDERNCRLHWSGSDILHILGQPRSSKTADRCLLLYVGFLRV